MANAKLWLMLWLMLCYAIFKDAVFKAAVVKLCYAAFKAAVVKPQGMSPFNTVLIDLLFT